MVCDPTSTAEDLFESLKGEVDVPDINITLPTFPGVDPNIFGDQPAITIEELTEGKTNGSGVFDKLMTSVTAHLDRERAAGRITNNDFAKSYVEYSTAALNASLQFLLSKDQTRWQAVTAQTQTKIALVELAVKAAELEEAKLRIALMAYQVEQMNAQTALTKMQLATAKVEYCTAEYRLSDILPKEAQILTSQNTLLGSQNLQTTTQTSQITAQTLQINAQTDQITAQTEDLLPEQVRVAKAQADGQIYQTTTLLPAQKLQIDEQTKLAKEQTETQRAQTLDTRTDGVTPVTGTLGKQKLLYGQQIDSYQKDAQLKAARPFIDAWITMKTIDEGTLPPNGFSNANLDAVLSAVRAANNL